MYTVLGFLTIAFDACNIGYIALFKQVI